MDKYSSKALRRRPNKAWLSLISPALRQASVDLTAGKTVDVVVEFTGYTPLDPVNWSNALWSNALWSNALWSNALWLLLPRPRR